MKSFRYDGKRSAASFWRRNGVFVALAIGLIALCLVAYYSTGDHAPGTSDKIDEKPVDQLITNQPNDRTTTTTTTTNETTTTTTTTTAQNTNEQLYVFPLSNTVQKPFSVENPVYSETMNDWRIHTGVDFAGQEGQTVKATAGGTVISVDEDRLWGHIITIDHSMGVVSKYFGVLPSVKKGDKVEASAPIGKLDEIPCESAQAPHLHMEMYVEGMPIDPISAIGLEVRYAETLIE